MPTSKNSVFPYQNCYYDTISKYILKIFVVQKHDLVKRICVNETV